MKKIAIFFDDLWEKIKIGLTPFFILFYIFLIVCWINRSTIVLFFSSITHGKYGYTGTRYFTKQ